MKFTPEEIEIAQSCKTADELVTKANVKGVKLSAEQAQFLLDSTAMEEIDESKIDTVSGGCDTTIVQTCDNCGTRKNYALESYRVNGMNTNTCEISIMRLCESCYQQFNAAGRIDGISPY